MKHDRVPPLDPFTVSVLCAVHGFPFFALAYKLVGSPGLTLSLLSWLGATILLVRRPVFINAPRWLAWTYGGATVFLWLYVCWLFVLPFSAKLFAEICLWALVVPITLGSKLKERSVPIVAWAFVLWSGYLASRTGQIAFHFLFGMAALAFGFRRHAVVRTLRQVSWPAFLPVVLSFSCLGLVAILRYSAPAGRAAAIQTQPGISLAYPLDTESWPFRVKPQVRFATETCDGRFLLLGLTGEWAGRPSLIRVERGTGALQTAQEIDRASNMVQLDCERGLFYVGSEDTGEVVAYRQEDLTRAVWKARVPGQHPRVLTFAGSNRILSILDDRTFKVRFVDVETASVVPSPETSPSHCLFSPVEGEAWTVPSLASGRSLSLEGFRFGTGSIERILGPIVPRHGGPGALMAESPFCEYDPVRSRLWFPLLRDGTVQVFRFPGGEIEATIPLQRGLRFISTDTETRLAAVANYITGKVTFIDMDTFRVLKEVRIGHRARWISFSRDHERVLIPSSEGVFEIHLQRAAIRAAHGMNP